MELLVVAGADAGSQFTLEGNEVLVGRGQPASGQTDVVRLDDKSISRQQAWIRRDATGTSIEHIGSAANPTIVNGAEISRARLSVGDRIEMGRVAMDVRAREGINLSGLSEIMEDAVRESTVTGAAFRRTETESSLDKAHKLAAETSTSMSTPKPVAPTVGDDVTEIRQVEAELGELCVIRGADALLNERFSIGMGTTSIGRGDAVSIQITEPGVSRLHAEIEIAGSNLELVHRSGTNQTFVNGFPILDRCELEDGDQIQLADRVVLEVHLSAYARAGDSAGQSGSGLSRRMEDKIDLEREIEQFNVMGSFLDVDVVESRLMKGADEKAEHIIVSFERFRAYVGGICEEWDGQVLNSNGDELMCFFESAGSALMAGSTILERLDAFNLDQNLLGKDFRFRIGVHTGVSLVDLTSGIAYSEVLDTAGHIQKQAEPNGMLISETTLESMPKGLPVTFVDERKEGDGPLYRLDRFLSRSDVEA
jgi:pSer/pThr/pTyr-binding forkhead associated (FHA) protein